jgi:hypothetical protein
MTTDTPEIVEGELALDLYDPAPRVPTTLFGTSDPARALEKMSEIARLLVGVVEQRQLVKRISGSDYLLAPGWAVLAGMTGLAPYTAWTRATDTGDGYIARVECRRITDGAVISAAEQVCTRSESRWARAEDHALLGMAQTRASSRALRGPLMQVVELEGYEPTPAEEMAGEERAPAGGPVEAAAASEPPPIRPDQTRELAQLIAQLEKALPENDWRDYCRTFVGGKPGQLPDESAADRLLVALREKVEQLDGPAEGEEQRR